MAQVLAKTQYGISIRERSSNRFGMLDKRYSPRIHPTYIDVSLSGLVQKHLESGTWQASCNALDCGHDQYWLLGAQLSTIWLHLWSSGFRCEGRFQIYQ